MFDFKVVVVCIQTHFAMGTHCKFMVLTLTVVSRNSCFLVSIQSSLASVPFKASFECSLLALLI